MFRNTTEAAAAVEEARAGCASQGLWTVAAWGWLEESDRSRGAGAKLRGVDARPLSNSDADEDILVSFTLAELLRVAPLGDAGMSRP
mmetsp:Transcript_39067/g.74858  ORF Transcript_39067/g.74858 Transcript_39067/m.74858 type:complete len:87 (+) Transcript_39067:1044-1304(+)